MRGWFTPFEDFTYCDHLLVAWCGMGDVNFESVVRHVRRVVGAPGDEYAPDAALLARFTQNRDEAAFAALVRRYGALVWGVCRRTLAHAQDAEDAFQATFLILTRHAPGLVLTGTLGSWLHQVAYHVALKARERKAPTPEANLPEVTDMRHDDPADAASRRELCRVVDEELLRLPDGYRRAIVLCDLLGRTHPEAATELGVRPKAVGKRLRRARELLRIRLAARGIATTTAVLVACLGGASVDAAPPSLAARTVQAAVAYSSGGFCGGASVLAGQVFVGSRSVTWKLTLACFVGVVFLAVGWAAWPTDEPVATAATVDKVAEPTATAEGTNPTDFDAVSELPPLAHLNAPTRRVSGRVINPDNSPAAGATVAVLGPRMIRGERGLRSDLLAVVRTDREGVFRAEIPRVGMRSVFDHTFQVKFVASVPQHTPALAMGTYHHDDDDIPVVLKLRPAVGRGRVVTPTGEPLAGITVRVERLGGFVFREPVYAAGRQFMPIISGWPGDVVTDAEGRFSLAGVELTPGTKLVLSAPGCAPEVVWVTSEHRGTVEATYCCQPARVASGR